MVTRAFIDSLQASVIGERTRGDAIGEIVDAIVSGWDGKRPVSAAPLYEQIERIHGAELAAAATLDLKAIADKHAILIDLPKHLKTLRLQERQELSARYHPRGAGAPRDAAPVAPVEAGAEAGVEAGVEGPADAGASTPKATQRKVGVPAAAAAIVLVAYMVARVFLLEDDAAANTWKQMTLPADPAALPCATTRVAGSILECTMSRAAYDGLSRADFSARAAVTKRAVVAAGKSVLRVRTDDGVTRGAY